MTTGLHHPQPGRPVTDLSGVVRGVEEGIPFEDAVSALVNLGYPRAVAEKTLDRIKNETDGPISLEDLLRKALKSLSR